MLDLSFYSQNVSIFDAIVTQKSLVGKGINWYFFKSAYFEVQKCLF